MKLNTLQSTSTAAFMQITKLHVMKSWMNAFMEFSDGGFRFSVLLSIAGDGEDEDRFVAESSHRVSFMSRQTHGENQEVHRERRVRIRAPRRTYGVQWFCVVDSWKAPNSKFESSQMRPFNQVISDIGLSRGLLLYQLVQVLIIKPKGLAGGKASNDAAHPLSFITRPCSPVHRTQETQAQVASLSPNPTIMFKKVN